MIVTGEDLALLVNHEQTEEFGLPRPDMWMTDVLIDYFGTQTLHDCEGVVYVDSTTRMTSFFNVTKFVKQHVLLVMPLNLDRNHWVLCVLDTLSKVIYLYNSLLSNVSEQVLRLVTDPMSREDAVGSWLVDDWTITNVSSCWKQDDSSNCGVAVIQYMRKLKQWVQVWGKEGFSVARFNARQFEGGPDRLRRSLQKMLIEKSVSTLVPLVRSGDWEM